MRALLRRITKLEDRRGLTEPIVIVHLPPSKPRPEVLPNVLSVAPSTGAKPPERTTEIRCGR